jgi:hypothetical protein
MVESVKSMEPHRGTSAPMAPEHAVAREVFDPTYNVMKLVEAEAKRQDNLREAEARRLDELSKAEVRRLDELSKAEARRIDEQVVLRAGFDAKLAAAESKRIDDIRAVDVAAVAVATAQANERATVLASQVAASAETLRALVDSRATVADERYTQLSSVLSARISLIEKQMYEGQGKQTVTDPIMADLIGEIKALREAGSETAGSGKKVQETANRNMWLIGLVIIIAASIMPKVIDLLMHR